ncbi:MAG: murein hydrolase activator EnvC family protein, partial [Actinomycetota bacterium]
AQMRDAERRLAEAEALLTVARTDLVSLEGSLSAGLDRLERLRDRLDLRIRETYKTGPGPYLELLVSSRTMSDFVARLHYMRKVFDEDKDRITSVKRLTKQLSTARKDTIRRKSDIEAQMASINEEKARMEGLRTQVAAKRNQVLGEISTRRALLGKVNADKAEYVRQMAALEAASSSVTSMLRARQAGQVYRAGGWALAWPTTGRLISGFGYRSHPIFGDRRFHTGVDISGSRGQAVVSAEGGVVAFVGWKGGYGLTVIIDHGNGLATLYAHLSTVNVGPGSRVGKAWRVGGVGCTGYCTGPHLHFETRVKGDPVDPMQYY